MWAYQCGVDPLTEKDYSARKRDIKNRLALLAEVFAIDVCAYALLSNHRPGACPAYRPADRGAVGIVAGIRVKR